MYKIRAGILTLSAAENYGAILQAYSLCEYINENFAECEIIDFIPNFIRGRYPVFTLNNTSAIAHFKSILTVLPRAGVEILKKVRFFYFKKNYCHFSKVRYYDTFPDDVYDKYIVGSDQVFNLDLTKMDREFFLPHVSSITKKATYAASIGKDSLNQSETEIFSKYLPKFISVSIREKSGCELIKSKLNLENISISVNIDSVFLHDLSFWMKFIKAGKVKTPYALIYAFSNVDQAYSVLRDNGITVPIIEINNSLRTRKGTKNARAVGPIEFLNLIYYANYVVTDSFHGTAFSIIFHKNFCTIPFKGTESRMIDLLDTVGLNNRLYSEKFEFNNIEYSDVDKKIETSQTEAKQYLQNFLLQ